TSPNASNQSTQTNNSKRWYRIEVPPGCVAVVPPVFHGGYEMLLNGHAVHASGSGPIDLRQRLHGEKNSLVIIAGKNDPLTSPLQFVTGATSFSLKPWTQTGLANFSGTAIYTKSFNAPETFRNKRILLDLGRVSSVADVFINGQHAGTLVWRPYRLDISKLVKPGSNEIKILVTNTEANKRAVGTSRHILAAIDVCGMEGPVRIIPYIDEVMALHPVQDMSKRIVLEKP
ncbi:MAG: glycosylhydrolase-like jelly roll fold domain-containing protein, partial [Acidobacteriaceae bacterium]